MAITPSTSRPEANKEPAFSAESILYLQFCEMLYSLFETIKTLDPKATYLEARNYPYSKKLRALKQAVSEFDYQGLAQEKGQEALEHIKHYPYRDTAAKACLGFASILRYLGEDLTSLSDFLAIKAVHHIKTTT